MQQGKEFKPLSELIEPDGSSTCYAVRDPSHPEGFRAITLEDTYRSVEVLRLPEDVPPEIRGYFDTARTLWVYGWFHYPFYTWAAVHADFSCEMGLRARLKGDVNPKMPLHSMLRLAVEKGLLHANGFTRLRNRHVSRAWMNELLEEIGYRMPSTSEPENPHQVVSTYLNTFRELRNMRVHAEGLSYMPSGSGFVSLEFARDLLTQLFHDENGGSRDHAPSI